LVKLASMDDSVLAALVEQVLASNDLASELVTGSRARTRRRPTGSGTPARTGLQAARWSASISRGFSSVVVFALPAISAPVSRILAAGSDIVGVVVALLELQVQRRVVDVRRVRTSSSNFERRLADTIASDPRPPASSKCQSGSERDRAV
jgi:hypothetical protein